MIGGTSLSAVFGSLPNGQPLDTVDGAKAYVRALADAGLAVLMLHPGTKEPADMRTPQKRGTDDRAARDAAREAGRPDWERVRAPQGLHLATTEKTLLDRYVKRWFEIHGTWVDEPDMEKEPKADGTQPTKKVMTGAPGINLAIEVGRSNVLVVDCDTSAQVNEFLEMCRAPADLPPTVTSPGQVGPNGTFEDRSTWHHADGGHFYFTVDPEHPLPTEIGSTVIGETGIAVLWHNRYVLIPPSIRAEGSYELTGREYPVPGQLAEVVIGRCEGRRRVAAQRADRRTDDEIGGRIDQWAQQITWTDILAPIGWVPTSTPDNCGCPMLTAPGDHSSPKSATAHDSGCSLGWWDNDVNAPLHIWTTDPGEPFASWVRENGLQTVTKFQAVALVEYGGNQAQAMDALGIAPTMDVDIEGVDVTAIATEDADPANLNEPVQDNLTANPESCEHVELDHVTGDCQACGEQIAPAQPYLDPDLAEEYAQQTAPDYGMGPGQPDPEQVMAQESLLIPGTQHSAEGMGCHTCGEEISIDNAYVSHQGELLHSQRPETSDGYHLGYAPDTREELEGWTQQEADQAVAEGIITEEEAAIATRPAEEMSLAELAGVAPPPVGEDGFPIIGQIDVSSGLYMPINAGVPEMAPFRHWRDLPPPEYAVAGLIEHGGLTCIIGAPGAGKSTLGLDLACHIALGRRWQGRDVLKTKVLYLPGEGLSGVVSRLNAWEEAHEANVGDDMIVGNGIIQLGATREAWAELREFLARQQIGMIIFDTFARMATNIDENSATDVGKAIKRFDQIRELTHCGVTVVHHTGKASPDVARGSSALNGALDSELLVRTDNERVMIPPHDGQAESWGKALHLRVTKQKNSEQLDEEIDLLMVNWRDQAPIITGPTGTIDPMQGEVLLARPVPEPLIETAVRIRIFADRFTEQGVTRADIAAGVIPDPYTQGLRYAERQWKLKVAEAVDRSLRWGLLDTLEGSSARYVSGDVGMTMARQIAAEEVMVPDAEPRN